MRTRKKFSLFFTAATLIAITACTGAIEQQRAEVAAKVSHAAAVSTVNEFYDVLEDIDSYSEIKALQEANRDLSKEEKLHLVATQLRGMQYFDTSSEEKIIQGYLMLAGGLESSEQLRSSNKTGAIEEVKITIPADAVVVSGDTAKVDLTKGTLSLDGVEKVNPDTVKNISLTMKKQPDGHWVLVPLQGAS